MGLGTSDGEFVTLLNSVEEYLDRTLCTEEEISSWGGSPLTKEMQSDWESQVAAGKIRVLWHKNSAPNTVIAVGDFFKDASGWWDVQLGTPSQG